MGWGTPDFLPPQSVLDALETVAQNQTEQGSYTIHQYTRGLVICKILLIIIFK